MKKVNVKSYENKFNNCKGDYVVEAKINYNLYELMNDILFKAVNDKKIEGFEFTQANSMQNCILQKNPIEELTKNFPFGKVEIFNSPNDIKFTNNVEFGCVCIYGRKSNDYLKEVVQLLSRNKVNPTSIYHLV